jgi:hypothetical protein
VLPMMCSHCPHVWVSLGRQLSVSWGNNVLFCFLVLLEFELRALSLICELSTTWAMPSAVFALVIFQTGAHAFPPSQPWIMILLAPPLA